MENSAIVKATQQYMSEAKEARRDRMYQNKQNYEAYHLVQDYSHKREGQSKEFLPKQAMAVEQISSFFQQGLVDTGEWFRVEPEPGVSDPIMTPNEMVLLLGRQLDVNNFYTYVGDAIKLGLLGSLMIAKVGNRFIPKPVYHTKQDFISRKKRLYRTDKLFSQLDLQLIRQEDYYPDPNAGWRGKPLYECQNMWMDLFEVKKLAEGPNKIYDMKVVNDLQMQLGTEEEQRLKKARETGQNITFSDYRKRIKLTECWGTLIDPDTGDVVMENCTWTIANDSMVIQEPTPNPFWHGESPFVVAPIIRVPHSTWHKALMDSGTKLNIAQNELFNLILDGGLMATHGIKQLRTDWLEDTAEVENGVYPGQTLKVNTNCPPGAKVLERVDTASVTAESLNVFNLTNGEANQAMLTNDLRMGTMPTRAVKATEVVEASQTITSIFNGVVKIIEESFISKLLEKSWMVVLQNMDDCDSSEVQDLIGKDRALALAAISPEDRFARGATGHKFKVFGVTSILNRMQDFRKLTSLLQTIGGSEMMMESFMKKYSLDKFLGEIMRALNINTDRIQIGEEEKAAMVAQQGVNQAAPNQGPNLQSQIPQAGAGSIDTSQAGKMGGSVPQTNFPRTSGGF